MKQDKWNKLNKELDDALDAEFGSEESNQESVFENAKSALKKHLFDNKAKVARDLEQMREWLNTNKQETVEEAAEEFSKNHSIYPTAQDDTEYGFKHGAKWQQERMYSEEEVLKQLNHLIRTPSSKLDKYTDDGEMLTMKWFEQFKKK